MVTLDEEGRLLFGNIFGKTRVLRDPGIDGPSTTEEST